MSHFRSLRWRLTFFYLGLLSVLLLLGGTAQYFAAREVLFRSNADVLTSEYSAVLQAFRRQNAARIGLSLPGTSGTAAAPVRAILLSQQFATQLRSRRISAAIFDVNGGLVAAAPATIGPADVPTLRTQDYLAAIRTKPLPYYTATGDAPTSYLLVLNVIRNGTRPIGLAQLAISTDDIDRTLRLDREVAVAGSLLLLLLALALSPLIVGRALHPLEQMSRSAGALAAGDYKQRVSATNTGDEIGNLAEAFNKMAAGRRSGLRDPATIRRANAAVRRRCLARAPHSADLDRRLHRCPLEA